MIKHITSVFVYEFRRNVTRKAFLFTAFAIPALLFALYGGVNAIAGGANDDAQEQLTQELIEYDSGYVDLSGVFADVGDISDWRLTAFLDEESALQAIESGVIDAYYLIAEDFEESGAVRLVLPEFSLVSLSSDPIQQLLRNVIEANTNAELAARIARPAFYEEIELQRVITGDSEVVDTENEAVSEGEVVDEGEELNQFWVVYGFAMIFMMTIFGTNGYLMQSVIEEKESRVVEILISSLRPLHLLAGKILAMGLLGIVQIFAWVGTVLILVQVANNADNLPTQLQFLQGATDQLSGDVLAILFVYFVLGYLFFAAVFGAVGAISTSLSNGPNYATVLTLPAILLPLMLISQFVDTPNGGLQVFMSLFPLTAPLSMVMRLIVTDVPIIQLILSVVLLIGADVFMIWLAGRLFRSQTLLAGQVPKLRDFPALLRG